MSEYNVYEDIAKRTNGDIYLGVVGPVRCGKSTFISSFIDNIVLPNINDENDRKRTIDEIPQSADGKMIMTTQPRFVPKDAVKIKIGDKVDLKIRLVDCVGYPVVGAEGLEENSKPRLVKTPWSDNPLPFDVAAEIGTKKVIVDHSTIAIMITTDGSFGELERNNYLEAEQKSVRDLKNNNRPFIIILNTKYPQKDETITLCETLEKKYCVSVVPVDVLNMNENDINNIFSKVLQEFPLYSLRVNMPQWLQALPFEDEIISEIISESKNFIDKAIKLGEIDTSKILYTESNYFEQIEIDNINLGDGIVYYTVKPKNDLFYKVLSRECGQEINNDFQLVSFIKQLAVAKCEYDKLKEALQQVEETGYGVVSPKMEEMKLEDPEVVKQGSRFGVRFKASAPSLHIMKVDVETEISPIVGTEQQGEDLVRYLLKEYESNPKGMWETNMFGKSLHTLVNEGLNNKIVQMPQEAQKKMRKTLARIVNEGKGGIICILL